MEKKKPIRVGIYDKLCNRCGKVIKQCIAESGYGSGSWVCEGEDSYYCYGCYYGEEKGDKSGSA